MLLVPPCPGQTVSFDDVPVWFSSTTNDTWSVAWGDVDADGDLDLACGNTILANALFLNDRGTLASTPAWLGPQATSENPDAWEATYSLAWGDVDGDGDLDLVCGNYDQPNTLYLNESGVLSTEPAWSTEAAAATIAVAWGDVDNDGDLDLVCGNYDQPNTLYLNEQGLLSTAPAWSTALAESTASVAWGDVDGDGDLDVAFGGYQAPSVLYLNEDGVLTSTPAWSSATSDWTLEVAWGDVDGDGDLDLACSSYGGQSKVYENVDGVLSSAAWWNSQYYTTRGLAWGDVDGDGDLDLACSGAQGAPNVIYLNDQGALSEAPGWIAGSSFETNTLAFGDVDGDGDLDLAVGNSGSNVLFLNERLLFPATRDWTSVPENRTRGVAWSDVDGDGDLDLVCANFIDRDTLYLNEGGRLTTSPSWVGGLGRRSFAVAMGDVDGDGDPDLAVADFGNANHIYLNEGGVLTAEPRWTSQVYDKSNAAAWGDLDGDHRLDLVFGNSGPNMVYHNVPGITLLPTTPQWVSEDSLTTESVALGDVDGDGDLDLACGNLDGPNTVYRNDDGVLSSLPVWESALSRATRSVAWGDVDGDGDLDLACGNAGEPNTLYLNEGGTLGPIPVWFSARSQQTFGVAWGDVDGDGDLDLACANQDGSTIYRNEGGTLSSAPVWSGIERAYAVAWADVDGDSDLDLALGNYIQPNSLYLGRTHPLYRGNPLAPTHHLTNNASELRDIQALSFAENSLALTFRVVDVESDPVQVRAEYLFQGDSEWRPLELQGAAGANVGPLPSSPGGREAGLVWDIANVPFDRRDAIVRLRVVELPRRAGPIQFGATYAKNVGRQIPVRPQIGTPDDVVFPTVTVGDSVFVELRISNTGTSPLDVLDIVLPSPAMDVTDPPAVLAPGESAVLTLTLRPQGPLDGGGAIDVRTNDPLRPVVSIPLVTDVRDLTFVTRLLGPSSPAPLGEAVPVSLRPDPGVRIERAAVFLRASGTAGGFSRSELQALEGEFFGALPAASVTELGLEYYVEVENSGIRRFDPPTAPAAVHTLEVASPGSVTTQVQPNLGANVVDDRDVSILVILPLGARFSEGSVFYRPGATAAYDSVAIEDAAVPRATVPAGASIGRGLEYWTRVRTISGAEVTDPPVAPSQSPRVLAVMLRNLQEPQPHPGRRYRLVSIPLRFGESFEGTLEDLLLEEPEFGRYDPLRWRLFRFFDDANVELTEEPALFHPSPGVAFWLISRDSHQIDTAPYGATPIPSRDRAAIEVPSGWSAIGNPFTFPVAWTSVEHGTTITDLTAFDSQRGAAGDYSPDPVVVLQPFEGYFVYNDSAAPDTLWVAPVEASASLLQHVDKRGTRSHPTGDDGWRMTLTASTSNASTQMVIGVDSRALEGIDALDRRRPPGFPGARMHGVSLSGPESEGLWVDLRPSTAEGHRWDLVLRGSTEVEEVAVAVTADGVPGGLVSRLLDVEQGSIVDLEFDEARSHRFLSSGSGDYRLTLLVGSADYVERESDQLREIPAQLVLDRNAPNPFNPATRIRFGLPQAGPVSLIVYSLRGERIVTLIDGELLGPGFHTRLWDGTDHRGARAASGVYFYRLSTAGRTITRKMVLMQ